MRNSTEKTGERIKSERLRANMTQSALAGDRISRNMLSMIESGGALPSLETLEYISNKLDVPAGVFLAGTDSEAALYEKVDAVARSKALYSEGRYKDAADVCRSVPFDDELTYILAEASLAEAHEDMKRFMLASAKARLSEARSAAARCSYIKEDFTGTVDADEAFIGFASSDIDRDELSRLAKRPSRVPCGKFIFLTTLSYLDRGDFDSAEMTVTASPYLLPDEMKYYRAKCLVRDFKFTKAIELFTSIEDSPSLGFITKYRIAADIEGCYENKRDFESALKYATKKHHILELFSK